MSALGIDEPLRSYKSVWIFNTLHQIPGK